MTERVVYWNRSPRALRGDLGMGTDNVDSPIKDVNIALLTPVDDHPAPVSGIGVYMRPSSYTAFTWVCDVGTIDEGKAVVENAVRLNSFF